MSDPGGLDIKSHGDNLMMGYGAGLGFGFGGWLAVLGCIALVVGVALLIAWVLGKAGQGSPSLPTAPSGPDPLEVLRLRFARGEITADEFAAAKLVLESGR
jgi:uncharacterized membrane protein